MGESRMGTEGEKRTVEWRKIDFSQAHLLLKWHQIIHSELLPMGISSGISSSRGDGCWAEGAQQQPK